MHRDLLGLTCLSGTTYTTDQRGEPRPYGTSCEIGAWEGPPPTTGPQLALSKAVSPTSVQPGEAITYTISFSNTGAITAPHVVITDEVSANIVNPAWVSSGVTLTPIGGQTYAWTAPDLAQGEGGVITITGVLTKSLAAGTLPNTVTLAVSDTVQTANVDLTVENVAPLADAGVDQQANVDEVVTLDGGTIADDPPTFSGEAEPGSTVQVRDDDGNVICETVADENGDWTCTPDKPLGDGEHNLDVVAIDEAGNESDPTKVAITVKVSDNEAPVAVDDAFKVPESVPAQPSSTLDVLANDSDPDDNPITIVTVGKPTHGAAKTNGQTITYTPEDNFLGQDTFTYIISDGALTDTANITLTIMPVADLSVSQDISATISGYKITIVARNLGPRDVISPGAVLSDTFPAAVGTNISWACEASGGAACSAITGTGHLTETLITFPANSVMTYTINASGGTSEIVWNTVTLKEPATMFDVVQDNNVARQPTIYRVILPLVYKNYDPGQR